jgi:hypothetical protein
MAEQKNRFCHDCSGRWDIPGFWHACPSAREASTEKWGHIHLRKFSEIKNSRQCPFCQLVCDALTGGPQSNGPNDDQVIYFSKILFGEYEAREVNIHSTGNPKEATWQCHRINHLRVSTFPSDINIDREFVRLTQRGKRLCKFYEGHIALICKASHDHYFFHGRQMDSIFNTILARQWIELCSTIHTAKCLLQLAPGSKRPSRVINVKERRVQYTPSSCSYVALSYRWPTSPTLTLISATEARLMGDGGLADHFDDILPIVKDSIDLSEKLGQMYLWVDAICIPQEEENQDPSSCLAEERANQLEAMKDIYRKAQFTIVACSNPDSQRGLPGIRKGSRHPQRIKEIGNLAYSIVKPSFYTAVKNSGWNRRIWTLQEAAQSCRLLIFTDHQVYFHCSDALWYEDTFLERPSQQDIIETDPLPVKAPYWKNQALRQECEFWDWTDAVHKYTKREASRESDFPKGLDFIKTADSSFICCLPEKYFAQALRFETWGGKRGPLDSPTWCWCGWKGPRGVCYEYDGKRPDKSEYAFLSCSLYRPEKRSPENMLIAIKIDDIGRRLLPNPLQTCPDILKIYSILSSTEINNLVVLYARVFEGSLLPGSKGLEEDCQILLSPFDNGANSIPTKLSAHAILALDCGKQKGDPVTCVDVGLDIITNKVWLLLVERNQCGISSRIGSATIDYDDWALTESPSQFVYLI